MEHTLLLSEMLQSVESEQGMEGTGGRKPRFQERWEHDAITAGF